MRAVDRMSVNMNGDFHEFAFKGNAQDIVDSSSFATGQGGSTLFPPEPAAGAVQLFAGAGKSRAGMAGSGSEPVLHGLAGSIEIRNNLDMRANEFGSILPRAIAPGAREVLVTLELFAQDDAATTALYQAARQQSPLSLMFQLGQMNGQLMGIYLKSLDAGCSGSSTIRKPGCKWKFSDTRAQGTADDEMVVAFG